MLNNVEEWKMILYECVNKVNTSSLKVNYKKNYNKNKNKILD